MNEIINNATFDDYEIEKIKEEKLNAIKKNRDIPLQVAIEEYKHMIFEGTPYTNSTHLLEKNIPQIKKADIVKYYGKIFNPKNITISINGNVDKDFTVDEFSEMFNSTDNTKFNAKAHKSEITPTTGAKTSIKTNPETNTDWIFLGWQVAGSDDKKGFCNFTGNRFFARNGDELKTF